MAHKTNTPAMDLYEDPNELIDALGDVPDTFDECQAMLADMGATTDPDVYFQALALNPASNG